MYSRDETVKAILALYQQLIKHPYLDESALLIPPPSGWTTIDETALRAIGKTDTVIDLLRHLPYLSGKDDGYTINYETVPIDFTIDSTGLINTIPEYPLPGHCIYITDGIGREGYRLIIDTEKGTTTAFSIGGYEEDYILPKTMPQAENWKAHRTCLTADFFAAWTLRYEKLVYFMSLRPYMSKGNFHCRADNRTLEEGLLQQEMPKEWIPDLSDPENLRDPGMRESRIRYLRYDADVYNTYMRYGWGSESFDKEGCRVTLAKMEWEFMRSCRDSDDSDDDSYHEPSGVRPLTSK